MARRPPPPDSESGDLLVRHRAGDPHALDDLFARQLSPLKQWASRRLPRWVRDLHDTQDLVQETLLQTFRNIEGFDHRGDGALQAYLRAALMNRIRDEFRRKRRRPDSTEVPSGLVDDGTSPLESAIGAEAVARYEAALLNLGEADRAAIVGRVELHLTYAELAEHLPKPSPDAARMAVARALVRLAEAMNRESAPRSV